MVLVGAMNPADRYHRAAMSYLRELKTSDAVYVPTSTLMEFDLVMRNKGYTEDEISDTWLALAPLIEERYVATPPSVHLTAAILRAKGLTYFDSLIASLATELDATIATRDKAISQHVNIEWNTS
jgi:predicted nucleic acid-binding protein